MIFMAAKKELIRHICVSKQTKLKWKKLENNLVHATDEMLIVKRRNST